MSLILVTCATVPVWEVKLMTFAFQSHSVPFLNCPLNRVMKSKRVKEDKLSMEHTGFIPLYQTRLHLHTVT